MAFKAQWREYFRNDYQPGEKKLVQKIDFFILTFCCLSYFMNYLDRSNLANAYVSGMKEDLGFVGNQYNDINTCFTVGYIIGQIPANLSLHYVKPRFFFPAMMMVWAGLTMVTASAQRPQSIMAIRFFQGIAEATTFVGTHYILGSWYTSRELGKRSGLFTASGLAGTMIGGFLQSGIYSSLDGHSGLAGWRWLFLVDGLVTVPVALYGLVFFPDTPATTSAFYLGPDERALAVARTTTASTSTAVNVNVAEEEDANPSSKQSQSPLSWPFCRRVLTSWRWWGFVGLWVLAGETESFSSNSLFALYLQAHPTETYTVAQLNDYPTGVPAVGIVSTLFWATLTDFLGGQRDLAGYYVGATGAATAVMVLAARAGDGEGKSDASTRVVFAAYYWAGSVYACQAVFFAWANDVLRDEAPAFRGVVLAGMNLGSNVVNAWWLLVFYGASEAPWFIRGMWAMIAVSIALVAWTAGLSYLIRKDAWKRRAGVGID